MKTTQAPERVPDVSSVAAIRAAFAQLRPGDTLDNGAFDDPTPEEHERLEALDRFLRAAVPIVLGTEPADAPRALSSWSAEQRAFLEELTKVPERALLNPDSLSTTLSRLGAIDLGRDGDDCYLRRYVGLAQPSALELEVDGRPLWLTLRLALMGRLDRSVWLKCVAGLDGAARVDLARRATNDAYHLMRRWPLARDLTVDAEHEDASRVYDLLLPMLEPLTAEERRAAISSEEAEQVPNVTLLLLLAIGQASAGEPSTATTSSLTSALGLFTNRTIGARLLRASPADRRRELIQAIELVPNNLDGWVYLELLSPPDRQRAVIDALAGFKRAAKPSVVACFSQLIRSFDEASRGELRALVAKGGPNAKAISTALDA